MARNGAIPEGPKDHRSLLRMPAQQHLISRMVKAIAIKLGGMGIEGIEVLSGTGNCAGTRLYGLLGKYLAFR